MEKGLSSYRFLTIREHRLACRTVGPEDGPTVVLIHAFASQSRSWDMIAAALAANGYRVIAPDLRGHGRSQRTSSYALDDVEHDLIALLDALQLDQVSLIGHSLGGHLALRLAMRVPGRIQRVIVEAAPVPPRNEDDAQSRQPGPPWRRSLRLLGVGRLLRLMLLKQFDVRSARTVLRELQTPMPHWWRQLAAITAPCLLLASESDGAFSERLDLLAAHIPLASTQRLGHGHHLHTRHPAAFLDAVIPFLAHAAPEPGDALLGAAVQ